MNLKTIICYVIQNWQPILSYAAAIGAVIGYFLTRRNELAWKRTEFVCTQALYLENDPDLMEVIKIIEYRHPTIITEQIYEPQSKLANAQQKEYQQKFDKFFNFLWRLCYAHLIVKTLSKKEIEAFGWYFWRIAQTPCLVEYCQNNGFEEIAIVITKFKYSKK